MREVEPGDIITAILSGLGQGFAWMAPGTQATSDAADMANKRNKVFSWTKLVRIG